MAVGGAVTTGAVSTAGAGNPDVGVVDGAGAGAFVSAGVGIGAGLTGGAEGLSAKGGSAWEVGTGCSPPYKVRSAANSVCAKPWSAAAKSAPFCAESASSLIFSLACSVPSGPDS